MKTQDQYLDEFQTLALHLERNKPIIADGVELRVDQAILGDLTNSVRAAHEVAENVLGFPMRVSRVDGGLLFRRVA